MGSDQGPVAAPWRLHRPQPHADPRRRARVARGDGGRGQSAREVLGEDIPGFCRALAGEEGTRTYRDRWREQLNNNVARKLNRLGG
ncbi:DUF1048 domain-containing protein [Streptomyces werraensis]|nr:DUF1048 domain-containing protein [Streptomyces werraensis]